MGRLLRRPPPEVVPRREYTQELLSSTLYLYTIGDNYPAPGLGWKVAVNCSSSLGSGLAMIQGPASLRT
jgi:hypothetical protein